MNRTGKQEGKREKTTRTHCEKREAATTTATATATGGGGANRGCWLDITDRGGRDIPVVGSGVGDSWRTWRLQMSIAALDGEHDDVDVDGDYDDVDDGAVSRPRVQSKSSAVSSQRLIPAQFRVSSFATYVVRSALAAYCEYSLLSRYSQATSKLQLQLQSTKTKCRIDKRQYLNYKVRA